MSLLSTYQSKLTFALGTAETNLMTNDKRLNAINEAVRSAVRMYTIPQYIKTASLAFVSGVVALPTNCLVPYELRDNTSQIEYDLVDFDRFADQMPYTYNITFDDGLQVENLKIFPTDTITLDFSYLIFPTELVTNGTGEQIKTRLNSWWDNAVAQKAAEFLFISVRDFSSAEVQKEVARAAMGEAWQMERQRLQGTQDQRLQSVYEKRRFISSGINLRN